MHFMTCNACKHLVQVNPTGICLGCQQGFIEPQEDSWKNHYVKEEKPKGVLDHAIQESIPKEILPQKSSPSRKRMGKGNSQRKKAPSKEKKEG